MDWVPINAEDISSEYTDAQVGCLVRFQLLISRLKRMPTDKELFREVSKKSWGNLSLVLAKFGLSPDSVCIQTLEYCDKCERKTKQNRNRVAKHRLKMKNGNALRNGHDNALGNGIDREERQDREEREKEKEKEKPSLSPFPKITSLSSLPSSTNFKPRNYQPNTYKEGLSYRDRTFNVIWDTWKQTLRGNRFESEEEFNVVLIQEVATNEYYALEEILECFNNYCCSEMVGDGKIMKLNRWLTECCNWGPEKKRFTSLDNALEVLEKEVKGAKANG